MNKIKTVKDYAIPLLCGVAFFVLMKFILFVGYVPTDSMAPTIPAKSYVWGFRIYDKPQKGDIVVFRLENTLITKRIAAVPGETVYIDDNLLTVSVVTELSNSMFATNTTSILTVPEDHYFLLGDNREHSNDSREWVEPFISREQIIAKLW